MLRAPRLRPQFAFTIVELLVVVAALSLLVGLLLPALGGARRTAREAQCMNHLRQLVIATSIYQQHFKTCFPQPFQDEDLPVTPEKDQAADALWFNALDPYLSQIVHKHKRRDPEERGYDLFKQDPVWQRFPPAKQKGNVTLKMNEYLGDIKRKSVRFTKAWQIREPIRTVLFLDGRANDIHDDQIADDFSATPGVVGLRHREGANVAFVDGHVQHTIQPIRTDTAAPSWYLQDSPEDPGELIWKIQ